MGGSGVGEPWDRQTKMEPGVSRAKPGKKERWEKTPYPKRTHFRLNESHEFLPLVHPSQHRSGETNTAYMVQLSPCAYHRRGQ